MQKYSRARFELKTITAFWLYVGKKNNKLIVVSQYIILYKFKCYKIKKTKKIIKINLKFVYLIL